MIYEPETVKGFQDFLPPKSLKREEVRKIIEKNFRLYGFLPVETPTIEFDELMRSDDLEEDDAISDRFRLKDKGGRNLGLRYELTFQLARIFKRNPNIRLPFRRYQIGKTFRDEPTAMGRFREFTQCDIDIIGDSTVEADAECLAVFSDILKELRINSEIQANNRKLLNSIIESVKLSDPLGVMRQMDKIDKIGEDQVKANLRKYGTADQIITLFKLLEKDLSFFVKNLFDGAEELKNLEDASRLYGLRVKFNPFLARGLSYYTGNIFEILTRNVGSKKNISLCGGGRYDRLVGKYLGREIPAVGISFGLERLTESTQVKIEKVRAVLISLEKNKETVKLASVLRKSGISCLTFFGKPGKALDFANSEEIPYAVFIGREEIEKKKKLKFKDMASGSEKYLTEKQLISKLDKSKKS